LKLLGGCLGCFPSNIIEAIIEELPGCFLQVADPSVHPLLQLGWIELGTFDW